MFKKLEKLCIPNWQKEVIDLQTFFKTYFKVKNKLKMLILKLKKKIHFRIFNFYNDQINPDFKYYFT